ncbi:helix-turn-helix domain-containing protein [Paenibacillus sp. MMS20-IR301]|uniref:helix-turn-helix domain-containing protein n=1 Tax=Paenibacillus sp. MMS20-IR301 TaxID=2895946 RepID=UPI0028E236AC|nr:helix-turn-helix domain-containing protein [Paenibacillus sp. MMS20-IR301]WNS44576.1 helix-turn-helix domain-containing protein [Paenibacillus sp. MMS20-IR301]
MYNLAKLYYPITANPAAAGEYLPGRLLQPYIRCYWGTGPSLPEKSADREPAGPQDEYATVETSAKLSTETIIPDSCMDIIWEWDDITGEAGGIFCGINDTSFEVGQDRLQGARQRFAIRFHFWAVHLFADEPLQEVLNAHVAVDDYFHTFRKELGEQLRNITTMAGRIAAAEGFLLRRLEQGGRSNDGMMNAVHQMLKSRGVVSAGELEHSSGLSSRQLERLFRRHIGLPPKKVADLVRFQNVWLELYRTPLYQGSQQDLAFTYGYSHQSHFINNFRKFAGRTPLAALDYANRR